MALDGGEWSLLPPWGKSPLYILNRMKLNPSVIKGYAEQEALFPLLASKSSGICYGIPSFSID
jgi:hypothetical protein